jgi:hypothetical protein
MNESCVLANQITLPVSPNYVLLLCFNSEFNCLPLEIMRCLITFLTLKYNAQTHIIILCVMCKCKDFSKLVLKT